MLISTKMINNLKPNSNLLGTLKTEWNAKMAPYIISQKDEYNILNFSKLSKLLILANNFLKQVLTLEGIILVVGTSKITSSSIKNYALKNNFFYVNYRWLGGTLTNWKTIQLQIEQLQKLEQEIFSSKFDLLSNKLKSKKLNHFLKLSKLFDGIKQMKNLPDVVIFTNPHKDFLAINECLQLGIPTISLIDTKYDSRTVTYPIPTNLNSYLATNFILNYLTK